MTDACCRIFVAGAVSTVGKSTLCLGLLGYLLEEAGVPASKLAYIKPATQCEKFDTVAQWCEAKGVRFVGGASAPIIYYPGLTRAVIAGEASVDLKAVARTVDELCCDRLMCVIDGVGFPGVGSCVGASNADVAKACTAPVVLVGKAGVGSAIDEYCLNATFFEHLGVPVLGAVFNKAQNEGFYAVEKIRGPIETFFHDSRSRETCYGVVPELRGDLDSADAAIAHLKAHVNFKALLRDAGLDVYNRKRRSSSRATLAAGAVVSSVDRTAIEERARADGAVFAVN